MQIAMLCYSSGSFSDWVSHILMVDFYYNLSTNETSTHWGVLWISTSWLSDRLWPVIDAPVLFASHLFDLESVWNGVWELLTLSKQCMVSRSSRLVPTFVLGDFVFLSSRFTYSHVWSASWSFSCYWLSWLDIVQVWTSSWMQHAVCLQLWHGF